MRQTRARFFVRRGTPSGLFRRLAPTVITALFALGGCSDATSPVPQPGNDVSAAILSNPGSLVVVVADASERIIPSLPKDPGRQDLANAFGLLSSALQTARVPQVGATLAEANSAISRYSRVVQGDGGVDAELDALRLVTDLITRELVSQAKR
jgi:hypothetical protein